MRAHTSPFAVIAWLATIACSDSTAPSRLGWPTAAPDAVGIIADSLDAADKHIKNDLPNVNAFLVLRRGKLVYEKYYHGTTRSTLNSTRSITKSVTSAMTGIAISHGWIASIDQNLGDLLPIYFFDSTIPAERKNITVRQMLTMSSGLAYDSDAKYPITGSWVTAFLKGPTVGAPGTRFYYDGSNPHLLSAIITNKTHRSLADIADDELFGPLDITRYNWLQDIEGFNVGSTSLDLEAQDMAKLGELYRLDGVWNGVRILPPGWVAASTTPAFHSTSSEGGHGSGYGYLWWTIDGYGTPIYAAIGYRQQWIIVAPEKELVVVIASESIEPREAERDHFHLFYRYVLPALAN